MEVTKDEKKRLKEFEKRLGISFKKYENIKRALMHKSYANENKLLYTDHNERYEYLGDAVLELTISHMLFEKYPNHTEGDLSKLRAAIVNEDHLAGLAKKIGLGEFLFLGKGEDRTGGRDKPSLLSDAFEAVLGAVFVDRGFDKAVKVVKKHFQEIVSLVGGTGYSKDYKTRLQEVVQGKFRTIPRYKLVRETGPDHSKTFEIHLYIGNEHVSAGFGPSKKAGEQDAARVALEKLSGGAK